MDELALAENYLQNVHVHVHDGGYPDGMAGENVKAEIMSSTRVVSWARHFAAIVTANGFVWL